MSTLVALEEDVDDEILKLEEEIKSRVGQDPAIQYMIETMSKENLIIVARRMNIEF